MSTTEALIDKLLAEDRSGGIPLTRDFLRQSLDLVRRYAGVEKLVLGGVRVSFSNVPLEMDLSLSGNMEDQGETLADGERARLNLPSGPILELDKLVEEQGIKVIPRRFPATSAALGGFFFDDELGPVILLNVEANASELDYALARQYGHFLADYEPYVTVLNGRPDQATLRDAIDRRAHQFALAFLMPRQDVELYRTAMKLEPATLTADFVQQLQVYFGVDPEFVLWRLLSLGWVDAETLRLFLAHEPQLAAGLRSTPSPLPDATLLPERFIRLVAHAFGEEKLDLEAAAKTLGTDIEEAQNILGQFQYPERSGRKKNGAARKD